MATWRATLFFEFGDYSWSETYFYKTRNVAAGVVQAAALDLAKAHLNLMGAGENEDDSPIIPYIRVSDDEVLRDAYVINDLAGTVSTYKGVDTTPVQPWDVLDLRLDIATGKHRGTKFLSCIPSEVYNNPTGVFNKQGSDWDDRYSAYVQEVLANWALLFERTDDPLAPAVDIAGMIRVGFHLQLVGVPYPDGGQRLVLRRGNYGSPSPIIRGRFYTVPSANTNAVITVPGLKTDVAYLDGATAQLVITDLQPITKVSFIKRTHHKRGALVGLVHRGRRTSRR